MNTEKPTTEEPTTKTIISDFWNEDEKEITQAAKDKRLKALRREAEIAVADLGSKADQAESALEEVIRNSFKGGIEVSRLFDLKRAAKIAKAKHADAIADYKEFFGEDPKLQ